MSFDAFMYSPTEPELVKGETQDVYYRDKNAIEILSFELGAENTINIGSISSGGGAGKATFKELTVTKKTDTSSDHFFFHCATGKHFKDLNIDLRRTGDVGSGEDGLFLQFKLLMVMVQDISWSGSDGDDICEETLILQFGAIQFRYRKQDLDGTHGTEWEEKEWSRVLNSNEFAVAPE